MKTHLATYTIMAMLAFPAWSCKKTKLNGNNAQLSGSWRWAGGYIDHGSADLRLDLAEKGKYKLYKGSKKIEYGRLVQDGNYLEFASDNVVKKAEHKMLMLDGQDIYSVKNDTLNIYKAGTFDGPGSTFVRE